MFLFIRKMLPNFEKKKNIKSMITGFQTDFRKIHLKIWRKYVLGKLIAF